MSSSCQNKRKVIDGDNLEPTKLKKRRNIIDIDR